MEKSAASGMLVSAYELCTAAGWNCTSWICPTAPRRCMILCHGKWAQKPDRAAWNLIKNLNLPSSMYKSSAVSLILWKVFVRTEVRSQPEILEEYWRVSIRWWVNHQQGSFRVSQVLCGSTLITDTLLEKRYLKLSIFQKRLHVVRSRHFTS